MVVHRLELHTSRSERSDWLVHCLRVEIVPDTGPAYRVPWRVIPAGRAFTVRHEGVEPLLQVRLAAWAGDAAYVSLPRRVLPGDTLSFDAPNNVESGNVVVRWMLADGTELLWPSAW